MTDDDLTAKMRAAFDAIRADIVTINDRLALDVLLYGEAYELRDTDGTRTRLDPSKIIRHFQPADDEVAEP